MTGVVDFFKQYGKTIALFVGGIIAAWRQVRGDGVTALEWNFLASVFIAGVMTYLVPNIKDAGILRYLKAITFFGTTLVGLLPAYLPGGITGDELEDLLIALGIGLGVIILPSQQWLVSGLVVGKLVRVEDQTVPVTRK